VGAGFQLAFSILFFLGMGHLADRWLASTPIFTLVGLAVGLGAGFYAFIRRVMAVSAGESGASKRPQPPPPPGK
jgi:F0F1-type ATP synthase assembly protein I